MATGRPVSFLGPGGFRPRGVLFGGYEGVPRKRFGLVLGAGDFDGLPSVFVVVLAASVTSAIVSLAVLSGALTVKIGREPRTAHPGRHARSARSTEAFSERA